jgi:5-methyltetrahydrofolate--homocysteine methyltransferase
MSNLDTAIRSGRVLLMDGAMGTELQRAGATQTDCLELWNITQPDKVKTIHRAYVKAGAEVLLSNTFQANRTALARWQQQENLLDIIHAGIGCARATVHPGGCVLADMGPMKDSTSLEMELIAKACAEADGLLLETFSDPVQASMLAKTYRSTTDKPVLVSFAFDGATWKTFRGISPEQCAGAVEEMGAEALGVNCGREVNMETCGAILRRYRAVTALPLFARVNAGTPTGGTYTQTAERMAEGIVDVLEAGATMIGGCCGTTPQHIKSFRAVVDAWNKRVSK